MKQILEVGDRVKLVNAHHIPDFHGSTGKVRYVAEEPHDDGTYTVTFVLDAESQLRMDKAPGFEVTASSANLKYLKPKKPKAAGRTTPLDRWIRERRALANAPYDTPSCRVLAHQLRQALNALEVVAGMEDIAEQPDGGFVAAKVSVAGVKRRMAEMLK